MYAILVMDSQTSPETLRSHNVSAAWSRVYKVEDYYLDLNLQTSHHRAVLMGQMLPLDQGLKGCSVDLKAADGRVLEHFAIGSGGDFRCSVPSPGVYELEIRFSEHSLSVSLEI